MEKFKRTFTPAERESLRDQLEDGVAAITATVWANKVRQTVDRILIDAIRGRLGKDVDLSTIKGRLSKVETPTGDLVKLDGSPLVWIGKSEPVHKGNEVVCSTEYRFFP